MSGHGCDLGERAIGSVELADIVLSPARKRAVDLDSASKLVAGR
jgi:hypothetical protein